MRGTSIVVGIGCLTLVEADCPAGPFKLHDFKYARATGAAR